MIGRFSSVLTLEAERDVRRFHTRTAESPRQDPGLLCRSHDRGDPGASEPRGRRRSLQAGDPPDRQGRMARGRLAQGMGRPGLHRNRAAHLPRRSPPRRRAAALRDPQHRRPGADASRHRRAEEEVPAPDPRRRGPLRDRLLRAGCGYRSGFSADARGPAGRPVRDQRNQDVHQRRERCRLHLAGRPDGSGGEEAQGNLHSDHADRRPGIPGLAHLHRRRRSHQHDLLRRRPRPGDQPRG